MVIASDQRSVNEKQASAVVRLIVDQDSRPQFDTNAIVPDLPEGAEAGRIVKVVSASDADLEVFTFSFFTSSPE